MLIVKVTAKKDLRLIKEMDKIEEIYCTHRSKIRKYLIESLKEYNHKEVSVESLKNIVKKTPFLMVAYIVNDDCIQESPNIYKDHINLQKQGMNRKPYLKFIRAKRDRFFLSDPYYNETSKKVYVLLYEELEDKMLFFNFDIKEVIKHLNLWNEPNIS